MIFRVKHLFIIILGFALTSFIFYVNYSWGNPLDRCFMLSFFTFTIFVLGWVAFWEIKDYWNYRWGLLHEDQIREIPFSIPINEKISLYAVLIVKGQPLPKKSTSNKDYLQEIAETLRNNDYKGIILFLQGFSDDIDKVKQYTHPLALAGYAVFCYDFRGVGKSRHLGRKNSFSVIVGDVRTAIDYLHSTFPILETPFNVVGISLGAMGALVSAFPDERVSKVVGVATVADFKKNVARYLVPFKGKWWIWLRYSFFGVTLYPDDTENQLISPIYTIQKMKNNFPKGQSSTHQASEQNDDNEWIKFTNSKLRLVHCTNDKIIFFHNFLTLVESTGLKPENYYVFKKGGHMFKMYELPLLSAMIDAMEH